ncbi:MAG: hypothetical protein ACOVSW_04115 [Candidatus Kapaibacteriota bacterium]
MNNLFLVHRVKAITLIAVQCLLFLHLNVFSQVLDTTFVPPAGLSPNLLALSQSVSVFSPLFVQPDGKILLNDDIRGVTRLLPDGGLDPSWTIHPALQISGVNPIHHIEQQSNGKILIAGLFDGTIGGNNWIIRLNSNGSLDPSFANVLNESPISTEIYDVAIQSDDKILVAGNVSVSTPIPMTNLIRLMPNGSVDNSFITDSIAGTVWTIKVQPDGKILAGGDFTWVGNTACRGMCRFNADGSIDNSFNSVSILGPLDRVRNFTVQADGKIIILTYSVLNVSRIIRLNSDGTEDISFRHGFVDNVMLTTALQPDGKIIVGGQIGLYAFTGSLVNIPTPKNFMRLNSDGTIDNTFGIVGEGFSFSVTKIQLLSSGKLLALGAFNQYGTTWVLPLVRLLPQPILAPSITTFSPSSGRQGDTITITGTNFTGATGVQFGNTNAVSFQVISATQIKAVVGSGNSGSLTVRTAYGTATSAGFTFIGGSSGGNGSSSSGSGSSSSGGNGNAIQVFVPSITGVSQNFGEFGSQIIIYGTRLDRTQSVRFGGVPARSFIINSPYAAS